MLAALMNQPGAVSAITPEMLAKSVSDAISQVIGQAVAQAITQALAGVQLANGLVPAPAVQPNLESVATTAANDFRARSTESTVVVHGDTAVLQQLRRDMGIDGFVFEETPASASIRSAAVSERQAAEVLPGWSEDLKWLASELGNVRDPETVAAGVDARSRDQPGQPVTVGTARPRGRMPRGL